MMRSRYNGREKWSRSLLFVPGAITFGLGTWQILRRQEKVEMLEYRRKRLEMEPIVWNKEYTSSKYNSDSLEFRRVFCEGYFDEGKSIYVGPRSRSISGVTENGYYIITPLIPKTYDDNNSVQLPILVNRGWVPRGWRDKPINDSDGHSSASRAAEVQPNKETLWWKFWAKQSKVDKENEPNIPPVRVIGVARGSEKPSIFVPENDPKTGQWFYVDVPMIARACSLPEDTLYIEDINENARATNPYPVPKDVNTLIQFSVMPQDHRNYTITWYSLSAAVTYMAVKRIKPKKISRGSSNIEELVSFSPETGKSVEKSRGSSNIEELVSFSPETGKSVEKQVEFYPNVYEATVRLQRVGGESTSRRRVRGVLAAIRRHVSESATKLMAMVIDDD
ncbi:uncharacterized protein A4U43_C03F24770 [Asparagus officinalis]|uniref:SURF1-like protein n=1 Tax=Asparagus officinalis TaxID=4686 RepID=A0A5P1FHW7_ASPOF|nr:uncharacterized protein A4U43_C03F24770 [Asparagus officinalis]